MNDPLRVQQVIRVGLLFLVFLLQQSTFAHGGVVLEEDRCVINIGFLTAHFTVYQPETRNSREYCEDIPDVTASVFVMEYLHDFLRQMPVDFRIIRDVNDVGEFARWEDVQAISDLEAATVYYRPPSIQDNGNYTAEYAFEEKGTYIGIVTAQHPDGERRYNAVFYFQVGGADLGTIPLFVGLLVLLQLGYWLSNGGLKLRGSGHSGEGSA
jgi:hypothetical protein